ncbi:ferredoxin [Zhongshania guokunii]|uniref:Ferredoxin n=1 Tax=Zhongshania guokunii TaxID=641783 RepID=A0ABV3U1C0_9GAMM
MQKSATNDDKTYKITADTPNCCGYGLCASVCPEIYKLDEDGLVYLATDTVSGELVASAIEGAASCPAEVLQVTLID